MGSSWIISRGRLASAAEEIRATGAVRDFETGDEMRLERNRASGAWAKALKMDSEVASWG